MSSGSRAEYEKMRREAPELFASRADDGILLLSDPDEIARAERASAAWLRARGLPEEWAHVGTVYQDQYVVVLREAVRFLDGAYGTYIRVLPQGTGSGGVAVLPVTRGGIVLVRHYRHAMRAWCLEIPRGFMDGSEPAEAARRELEEEIGGRAVRLEELGPLVPDSGLLTSTVHLFWAEVSQFGETEAAEGIGEVVMLSAPELRSHIACGSVADSFTIAAFARAQWRGLL